MLTDDRWLITYMFDFPGPKSSSMRIYARIHQIVTLKLLVKICPPRGSKVQIFSLSIVRQMPSKYQSLESECCGDINALWQSLLLFAKYFFSTLRIPAAGSFLCLSRWWILAGPQLQIGGFLMQLNKASSCLQGEKIERKKKNLPSLKFWVYFSNQMRKLLLDAVWP